MPPFRETSTLRDEKVTDEEGYILVDGKPRVHGVEKMYAVEYVHEMRLVIDEGGSDSIYLRKEFW